MTGTHARPNQPIRPPSPLPTSPAHIVHCPPPWTRSHLERERDAFFDTRVTGDEEAWKALRMACETLRQHDLPAAQGILDAMGLTCPHGRVASGRGRDRVKGGIYDERGVLYELPGWVVADPQDVVEGEDEEKEDGAAGGASTADPACGASSQKDEKGKGRAEDIGPAVRMRCRLSDRATDVVVDVGSKQRVAVVIRKIQEQIGSKRIRLMYLGKTWNEGCTIEETGWREGNVVNALVYEGDEGVIVDQLRKAQGSK